MPARPLIPLFAMALILFTSSCSREQPSGSSESSGIDVRSTPAMSEPGRASAQQLALLVGPACAEPSRMQFHGDRQGKAYYSLDCGDSEFLVSVAANGSGQAVNCAAAAKTATPCWKQW